MSNTDIGYEKKYLKYRKKYLNLKNQLAGSNLPPPSKLTRSTNEHEWGEPTNPEDDLPPPPNNPPILQRLKANPTTEDDLPPPPNNPPILQRLKANPTNEDHLPPPPNNPPILQRLKADSADKLSRRPRLKPIDGESLSSPPTNPPEIKRIKANPSYENSYTVILSGIGGGRILRDMERRDLENNDILITSKRESFLIDFFLNLTLFNGKIYSVKINSIGKTIYLTDKEN